MLQNSLNTALFRIALVLGICGIISAWIVGQSLVSMKKLDQSSLSVTGSAQQEIISNLATWTCRFSRQADTIPSATNALKTDLTKVLDFLKAHGVDDAHWKIKPIESTTLYGQTSGGSSTNTIEGYRLTQAVQIEHPDVKLVTKLAQDTGVLMSQGIGVDAQSPEYFYTKLNDLKVQMLGQAMQNAKARAEQMASSTGAHIGSVRSAQMGVFQITPKNSTEVSDYGVNDTTTIEKNVTAVVNASFGIE